MSLAHRAAGGVRWAVVSIAGRRVVTVLTSLVLARLVSPADFGLMAMAVVFTGFVDLMRELGTGAAVVRAENPHDDLLSTLFWLNIIVGIAATVSLVAIAPVAAALFRQPRLTELVRVLAITPLLAASTVVSVGLLTRGLDFRRLAVSELGGACVGGAIGIALALRGYGVWSLVWQAVSTAFASALATGVAAIWVPSLRFRFASVRHLMVYSANLTGTNVLTYIIRNADNLLIGRYLGPQSLGLYDLAFRVMMSSLQVISAAVGRVLFPIYVQLKSDHERLRAAYLKVTAAIALMIFPVILGVTGVADTFVAAAFGPRWMGAVPLLVILAPLGALQSIATSVQNIYQTVGRTDLLFRWTALTGVLLVSAFAIGLRWDVAGVAGCYTVVSFALAYWLFSIPLRMIGLPVSAMVKSVGRPLLCSLVMLASIAIVRALLPDAWRPAMVLFVTVPSAALVYAVATWTFNRPSAAELLRLAIGA